MTAIDFQLRVDSSHAPFTIVAVAGELDNSGGPLLRSQLDEMTGCGATEVTLDLSEVVFIDSTGLGILIHYHRLLHAEGGRLQVIVTQPNIRRIFEITGIDKVLHLYESLGDALIA